MFLFDLKCESIILRPITMAMEAMKLLCSWHVIQGKMEIFIQIVCSIEEFQLSNKNINRRLFTSTDFPKVYA